MSHIQCCMLCVAPKRHENCWSDCEDYQREKEIVEKEKQCKRKIRDSETYYIKSDATRKIQRRGLKGLKK